MILIITSKQDGHINSVTKYIDENKTYGYAKMEDGIRHISFDVDKPIKWIRLNIEDFANNVILNIFPNDGEGTILIIDSGLKFNLSEIKSVWYRKPEPISIAHFELEKSGFDYVEAEFNEIIMGLYALLNKCYWINDPFKTRLSHRKLLQLKVANQVGFTTPETLISNESSTVLKFAENLNWDIAIKSLGAISVTSQYKNDNHLQYGLFTRRINKEELTAVQDKILYMPTIYQQYIKKKFELRITCVDKEIFSCRIDSQKDTLTKEDMRFSVRNIRHDSFDCKPIHNKLLSYLDYFGLNFGCFDIAVDENDNYIFFECNPNGQWLWVEDMSGLKISKAIATLLINRDKNGSQH